MFNWLLGGDYPSKGDAPPASGFHPIQLPLEPSAAALHDVDGASVTLDSLPEAIEAHPLTTLPDTTNMFGSMLVTTGRRRRRPAPLSQPSAAQISPMQTGQSSALLSPLKPSPPPISSSTSMPSETVNERGSTLNLDLRQRLERFYTKYDPSKLGHIDAIVAPYHDDNAELLFTKLTAYYGPEPQGPSTAVLQGNTSISSVEHATVDTAPLLTEVSAFQFITAPLPGPPPRSTATPTSPPLAPPVVVEVPAPEASHPSIATTAVLRAAEERRSDPPPDESQELHGHQEAVQVALSRLERLMKEGEAALSSRHDCIVKRTALEATLSSCIAAEDYTRADSISSSLQELTLRVQQCDDLLYCIHHRIMEGQASLEEALRTLQVVLGQHEEALRAATRKKEMELKKQLEEDCGSLECVATSLRVEQDDVESQQRQAERRCADAETEVAQMNRETDERLLSMRQRCDELLVNQQTVDEEIASLEAEVTRLKHRRVGIDEELHQVSTEMRRITTAHDTAVEELRSACQQDFDAVTALQSKSDEIKLKLEAIEKQQRDRSQQVADAQQLVEKANHALHETMRRCASVVEEQMTAASVHLWSTFAELLAYRLSGAEVAFSVECSHPPTDNAPQMSTAIGKRTEIMKRRESVQRKLNATELQWRDTRRRVDELEARIPPLSTDKAVAVANRQFREAQYKREELASVEAKIVAGNHEVSIKEGEMRTLVEAVQKLNVELIDLEEDAAVEANGFLQSYGDLLQKTGTTLSEGLASVSTLEGDKKASVEALTAAQFFWKSLNEEWCRACATHSYSPRLNASSFSPSVSDDSRGGSKTK